MLFAVVAWGVITASATAQEHDHASCPMAADHKARATEVDHRHGAATGIDNASSGHHFLLRKDGGEIRLGVSDPSDIASRDRIREHLKTVAAAFGRGDFDLPNRIHGTVPPGVAVMQARKAQIRYAYAETENGAAVRIVTKDAEALAAIHEFLSFQISDHGTGDTTSVLAE